MLTYGDLFPYPKITLGDLVNSMIVDDETALGSTNLPRVYKDVLSPKFIFGREVHDLNADLSGNNSRTLKKLFDSA